MFSVPPKAKQEQYGQGPSITGEFRAGARGRPRRHSTCTCWRLAFARGIYFPETAPQKERRKVGPGVNQSERDKLSVGSSLERQVAYSGI